MSHLLPTRVTRSPDVLFQELDGEGVLLNLKSERYFSLDDVGMRMWQVLEEYGAMDATVARLLNEYETDEETLRLDLTELVEKLARAGLVSVS